MMCIILLPEMALCQKVESNTSTILINTLPDKEAPVIKLITPSVSGNMIYNTDKEVIDLIGEVKDPSGVKFISVNSDIRNMNEEGIFSTRLNLVPGKNEIRLVAVDKKDNLGEQVITVNYQPPVKTLADKISEESKYYGLIIGIEEYEDPGLSDLEYPIDDAEKLYNILQEKYYFRKDDMMLLKNPTRNDIVYALDYLAQRVTPADNVLIFYAGHGYWDEDSDVGYWLPSDAYQSVTANWFRNSALVDYLRTIHSKHTLLITDACFAGSIFKSRGGFGNRENAYEILYGLPSRKAMTSGTLTEVPDRSSFTRYLLARLESNEETYLSSEQLFSSFRLAVINNSKALPQYGEIQNVGDEGGDFIFLRRDK